MDATTDPDRRRVLRARPTTALLVVIAVLGSLLSGIVPTLVGASPPTAAATATSGSWTIERVSVGAGGVEADGPSDSPVISDDGSSIVFRTDATNLVPGTTSSAIVRRDLATGATERVSVETNGAALSLPRDPAVDADGSRIAMTYTSGGERAIAVRDRASGTTDRNVGNGIGSQTPAIPDEGDRVAFVQGDVNPSDNDRRTQVWLHDERPLAPGEQRLVQVSGLTGLDDQASQPTLSADGDTLAYLARIGGVFGTRVQDISARPFHAPEWYPGATSPSLSEDGRYLAALRFVDGAPSVVRHDRLTGADVTMARLPDNGSQVRLSRDGTVVAYTVTYRDDADEYRTEIRVSSLVSGRTETVATVTVQVPVE